MQRLTQIVQIGAQWALVALPILLGILIGGCVYLAVIWWRAFVRGYTLVIGRLYGHA